MNGLLQIVSRLGSARIAAMVAVTLALVGFFAFVIMRVTQPSLGVLFTELSASDAGAISRELDQRGVTYELRDDGQTILAPRSDLARLRMDLAGKSLPSGGGVGYEIFDKGDAFSSTSFVQNINHLRALEGELARTIRTIGRVESARVHLALPEKRLFERDREAPRASIVLRLRGDLGSDQIRAIRHLVASAVEGLSPEHISIVDERGRLLADGAGSDDAAMSGAAADERRIGIEKRLRSQVEELVAGIVGPDHSRVQVAAELDSKKVESRSENYDPESKVVRSTQTRGENQTTANGEGQVSVGNELPGAKEGQSANAPHDTSSKNEEVVNYEISRTTRTETLEAGRLKRLSVAVLVDGTYGAGKNGERTYQPRSKEELERITALVRSAVGYDKSRGDDVEVVNLPFAQPPAVAEPAPESLFGSLLSPTKEDVLRLLELAVTSFLTLIVLMVVVRPMVKRILAPDSLALGPPLAFAGAVPGAADGAVAAIASPVGTQAPALASSDAPGVADQLARLGEMARSNPKEAAAVLRGWISER